MYEDCEPSSLLPVWNALSSSLATPLPNGVVTILPVAKSYFIPSIAATILAIEAPAP